MSSILSPTAAKSSDAMQRRAVLRWLTIAWLLALGVFLSDYYTVDLTLQRKRADWYTIGLGAGLASVLYVAALLLQSKAGQTGRAVVAIVAALAALLLLPLVAMMGLFAGWAYNLFQYLCLVLLMVTLFVVAIHGFRQLRGAPMHPPR